MAIRFIFVSALLVPMLLGAAVPATAASARRDTPETVRRLLDCRKVAETAARLACFDREGANVAEAVESQELIVADKTEVSRARRSLFGLTLPGLAIFGTDNVREEVKEIDAVLKETRRGPDRNWRMVLEDGSRWIQTDALLIPRDPRPGMPIRIRRAAGGSFLANISGQIAVRVARVN